MEEEFGNEVAMTLVSSSEYKSRGEWTMPGGEAVAEEARVAKTIVAMTSIRHRTKNNKIGVNSCLAETFIFLKLC